MPLGGRIVVGKLVEKERPTFADLGEERLASQGHGGLVTMSELATRPGLPLDLAGKERVEVRLAGFGGDGIVLAGYILGRAAAVHAGRNAVMSQSYGPKSRGGACMAERRAG